MNGFVTHWPWYVFAFTYLISVVYFAVGSMFDGDEWWLPFLLPVFVPCWWVYENHVRVAAGLVIIFLLIGILAVFVKVSS